jgi:hypothetical protein
VLVSGRRRLGPGGECCRCHCERPLCLIFDRSRLVDTVPDAEAAAIFAILSVKTRLSGVGHAAILIIAMATIGKTEEGRSSDAQEEVHSSHNGGQISMSEPGVAKVQEPCMCLAAGSVIIIKYPRR